jgi:uncharacterized protein (TIRG00374 family)
MKKKLGALLRVVVSVGILVYLFNSIFQKEAARYFEEHQIDPDTLNWTERARIVWTQGPNALWEVFQQVNIWWFALGTLAMGVVCLLGIVRWQLILRVQGLELKFPRASSIFFVGMFFNAFMLGSTGGDVIKAWYVAHETHHKKAEAVATVVVDRLIGLLALFVLALIMMTAFYHRVFDDVRLRTFAVITLVFVLTVVLGTVIGFWRGFADKFPKLRTLLTRLPYYETLRRMVVAYRVYASHPVVLANTTLMSFGVHLMAMISIVCVGKGLGITTENGLVDYFLYLPIINSVTAIPISISGFGVRELMYAQMFAEVGVTQSQGVAMSLIGYLASLFWSLVGSIFYLTHRKELPPAEVMATEDA